MLINGEKKLGHIIGQSRSENQFKHLTIRVDPETFAGNVIFIDEWLYYYNVLLTKAAVFFFE